MAKRQKPSHNSRSDRRSEETARRNKTLLIFAILFFLLGLYLFARASGYDFSSFGSGANPNSGMSGTSGQGTGTNSTNSRTNTLQPGGSGSGAGNSGGGDNSSGQNSGLDVNVNTDSGAGINAGADGQGNLYVDPKVTVNPQGGTGGDASVNNNKIIDF